MTKNVNLNDATAITAAQAAIATKAAMEAENARKAEAAKATLLATDSGYRAYDRFLNMTGRRAIKTNEVTKATLKAIGENLFHWLEKQSEEIRAELFADIEFGATSADAKRIAKHPLRPVFVTEMVDAMDAEAKAAKEAEALAAAKAAAQSADNNDTSGKA